MGKIEQMQEFFKSLNKSKKILILGNHDRNANSMYKIGFDVVLNSATLYIANERVTMSHCPLRGVYREDTTGMSNAKIGEHWHGENRHQAFSVTDEGQWHLHGHIHSGPANTKLKTDGKQYDVGVCANQYRPVSISVIESWIATFKGNKK
jgi:calcineurin-like phosphoesterase family protein